MDGAGRGNFANWPTGGGFEEGIVNVSLALAMSGAFRSYSTQQRLSSLRYFFCKLFVSIRFAFAFFCSQTSHQAHITHNKTQFVGGYVCCTHLRVYHIYTNVVNYLDGPFFVVASIGRIIMCGFFVEMFLALLVLEVDSLDEQHDQNGFVAGAVEQQIGITLGWSSG